MSLAKEFIKHLMEQSDGENEVVIKTFKAKPEWVKRFSELEDIAHEEAKLTSRRKSLRDGLWGTIHEDLDIYDKHLKYNDETMEIEMYEDKED